MQDAGCGMQRNKMQDAGNWEEEKQIHRRGAEYAEKKKRIIRDTLSNFLSAKELPGN